MLMLAYKKGWPQRKNQGIQSKPLKNKPCGQPFFDNIEKRLATNEFTPKQLGLTQKPTRKIY